MRGPRQLKKMFPRDPNMRELIDSLWREGKVLIIYQPGHNFVFGSVIKPTPEGWINAQADTESHANATAIVTEVIDADNFIYTQEGIIYKPESDPPESYIPGAKYFLSVETAGEMFVQTTPEVWVAGQFRQFLGTGTPDGGFMVEIDEGATIVDAVPSVRYQWLTIAWGDCVEDTEGNTGYRAVTQKKQISTNFGPFVDVVPEVTQAAQELNTTYCPLKLSAVHYSLHNISYDFANEVHLSYLFNASVIINTYIRAGASFLFISIPRSKYLHVFNSAEMDITDRFYTNLYDELFTDLRAGCVPNSIYQLVDAFATEYSIPFKIIVNDTPGNYYIPE